MVPRSRIRVLSRARDQLAVSDASVAVVAAEAGLSTGRFIKQFAAVFGDTPHQHRVRVRLERAKSLLMRDHTVTEACFAVGFQSVGSFSDAFQRRVGLRPSEYQRQRRLIPVTHAFYRPGCFGLLGPAYAAMAILEKHPPIGHDTLGR